MNTQTLYRLEVCEEKRIEVDTVRKLQMEAEKCVTRRSGVQARGISLPGSCFQERFYDLYLDGSRSRYNRAIECAKMSREAIFRPVETHSLKTALPLRRIETAPAWNINRGLPRPEDPTSLEESVLSMLQLVPKRRNTRREKSRITLVVLPGCVSQSYANRCGDFDSKLLY